jgi:alpha-N-acetylglucosamine transferase
MWSDSFTKLLAFNQTQYDRVLSVDSDCLVLQHMDELFLIPSCPIAMPRAYWLLPEKSILSSHVMLIEPSEFEFARVMEKINNDSDDDYDMEIVNQLYHDSALVLPHRPYGMLTGEFRGDYHAKYMGNDLEPFDSAAIYNQAKMVHFSDWPAPKPWIDMLDEIRLEIQPECIRVVDGSEDCTARNIWNQLYSDFASLRKVGYSELFNASTLLINSQDVCGRLLLPAPNEAELLGKEY